MAKKKKLIPFEFVLEALADIEPTTKPMFGSLGVYHGDKIVFILRERTEFVNDNGVWLATTSEHHASLQKEFSIMRSIEMFGPGPTGWQNLPVDSDEFEESVLRACDLVLSEDPRIGKIPKSRLKKKSKVASKTKKTPKRKKK